MIIDAKKGAAFSIACALLVGAATVAAADKNKEDPFERQRDAAEKRYEMAKESCSRLRGEDEKRCKDKAKADYSRELETLRQEPSPSSTDMGTMPGGEDPDGIGVQPHMD